MRKTLFIGMIVLSCSHLFGQTKIDSTFVEFIKSKKYLVALTDTSNLPVMIRPYYDSISNYLSKNKIDKNDYFVYTNNIDNGATSLFIPICHYDGLKKEKELKDQAIEANKNRKEGDLELMATAFIGNPSGKDGILEVEKTTKKVISFKLWQ